MKLIKLKRVFLRDHATLDEKWVQERIAEDPSILGLGDLILKDKERRQPKAGRLDLLLQDRDAESRYEVEIQLGATDETHIIRTLEYWDIERKRYPAFEHKAVIVAEDITNRFLNVIGLFNSTIPIIAIQMEALTLNDGVALHFTRVLDEVTPGKDDSSETGGGNADRSTWEQQAAKDTLALADEFLKFINEKDPSMELKYNIHYIGLARNGVPDNFCAFKPKRRFLRIEIYVPKSEELEKLFEEAGVDASEYDTRRERYLAQVFPGSIEKNRDVIRKATHLIYDLNRNW